MLSGFELLSADGWCQWSKQTRCLRLSLSVCFNFNVARCHSVPQRLVLLLWVKLLRCPWMPRHRRYAHTAWWSVKPLLLKTFQLVMLRRTNIQTLWVFRYMNSDKGTHHCFYNQVLLFVFIDCFTMNTLFLCSLNISIKNCDQRIAFFFFFFFLHHDVNLSSRLRVGELVLMLDQSFRLCKYKRKRCHSCSMGVFESSDLPWHCLTNHWSCFGE